MSVKENLARVLERISQAALKAGKTPQEITLLGVAKAHRPSLIQEAVSAGLKDIGENYVQEALKKAGDLKGEVRWHLIGPLQTNKARHAVGFFHLIHTLDRVKLALELDRRAETAGLRLSLLIQVNLTKDPGRAGVLPENLRPLLEEVAVLKNIEVLGLMTVPPFLPPEEVRPYFARLRELKDEANSFGLEGIRLKDLSMGMSADFEEAIKEGATIVRIGTAIFGERER